MKYRDTTDPATYRMLTPVITNQASAPQLDRAARIRFSIVGLYHSIVGPAWSSHGQEQTDFFHYIHLACGGRARIFHRGSPFELTPGFAYWLTGNTPVVRDAADHYESYVLKFRCESTEGADLLLDWPGRKPVSLGPWDHAWWEKQWRQPNLTTTVCLALQGQLRLWLAAAFPDLDEVIDHHNRIFARFDRALSLLERRLGADLRVQELAAAHRTSLHAFSMAFERSIGLSPKAYLNRRLNQEACALLLNPDWRIKEVAVKLSFADEFYFSRFFSKMNGMSPRKYRQQFGVLARS
jgi:AraC-like DNA-binding protein